MNWARLAGLTLAVLFFAAANGAGYLSLNPSQVWVFQSIMFLIGLVLVVVFTVGEHISR